jgi:hypothetical protein
LTFLASIDETFANTPVHPKHQVQGVRPEARDLNDLGDPARIEAAQPGSRRNVFKSMHPEFFLRTKSLMAERI